MPLYSIILNPSIEFVVVSIMINGFVIGVIFFGNVTDIKIRDAESNSTSRLLILTINNLNFHHMR
jgi:hypothetical protein